MILSCLDFPTRGSTGTRVSYRVSEDGVHLIIPVPGASFHPDDSGPLKDGQQGQLHADREGPEPGNQQAQHPSLAEHDATRSTVQPQSRLHPWPLCRFVQTDILFLIIVWYKIQLPKSVKTYKLVQQCGSAVLWKWYIVLPHKSKFVCGVFPWNLDLLMDISVCTDVPVFHSSTLERRLPVQVHSQPPGPPQAPLTQPEADGEMVEILIWF